MQPKRSRRRQSLSGPILRSADLATPNTLKWSIEKTDEKCHRLVYHVPSVINVPELLCLTDLHWDSAHCARELLKDHLEKALANNTPVVMFGDVFDVMQGKWDPRASQDALREEHRGSNYLDRIISTAIDWFKPYAKIIALVSPGNHEQSIAKRHETSLISRFVQGLQSHGSPVVEGGYWGFMSIQFLASGHSASTSLHYHHGYGGGGEVTRGQIDNNRTRSQYYGNIFVSGHIHRRNFDENIMLTVDAHGRLRRDHQLFLRCASYKDEVDGWHAEKGRAARPLGGWLVRFKLNRQKSGAALTVHPEPCIP